MLIFQELPPTRFDVRFSIAGIPVRIHPVFWLLSIVFWFPGSLQFLFIWVLALLIGLLVHEMGHALAFRRFGQRSHIVIHFMGLTVPEPVYWGSGYASVGLTANQQIFISLAGPVAGFVFSALLLGIVAVTGGSIGISWLFGFIPLPLNISLPLGGAFVTEVVRQLLWISILWGGINLMPVFPLDGGSVARNLWLQLDPIDGIRKSLWLSVVTGALLALVGLIFFRSLFMALLFGFLAFQSYQSLQGRY